MYAEPDDLDRDDLANVLRTGWGIVATSIDYRPIGFGTHHYVVRDSGGTDWFVNVDDLTAKTGIDGYAADPRAALERALRVAMAAREAGFLAANAPLAHAAGGAVADLGTRFAVAVYPYIDGTSGSYGPYTSDEDRRDVHVAIGRLHAATALIPAGLAGVDSLEVPGGAGLATMLDSAGDGHPRKIAGPYAERARAVLRTHASAVRAALERHDRLANAVRRSGEPWVITHGEPHAGNVMRRRDGTLLLIDWDTVALAPRERDLAVMRVDDPSWTDADRDAYRGAAGTAVTVDEEAIAMYRLRWTLTDVAICATQLLEPHADDENTRMSWRVLRDQIGVLAHG